MRTLYIVSLLLICFGVQASRAQTRAAASLLNYPAKIEFDKQAFQKFSQAFQAFKEKYGFNYLTVKVDSVGCTVSQLALAAKPIALNLQVQKGDTAAAVLAALSDFIDENKTIFNTTAQDVSLNSVVEKDGYISVIFETAVYGKFRSGGESRGMIEFVVSKKGTISVMVSTSIRKAASLPEKEVIPLEKIYPMLMGKTIGFYIGEKRIAYTIDRLDVIKPVKTCVYEARRYQEKTDNLGNITERILKSVAVHLVYEVEIDIGEKQPVAKIFIDAINGKEVAQESTLDR
jgi:hypothetical protein